MAQTRSRLGAATVASIRTDPSPTPSGAGDAKVRGILSSLRAESAPQAGGAAVHDLPLDQVATNPDNPRESLGDLAELAASIAAVGVLQPVLVRSSADFVQAHPEHADAIGDRPWVLNAGHRRLEASRQAGQASIPAIVAAHDQDVVVLLSENFHRKDFTPLEEARGFALLADTGLGQRKIAEIMGVSQSRVSKRLALLKLAQPVQDTIVAGDMPVEDAVSLSGLSHDDQVEALGIFQGSAFATVKDAVTTVARRREEKVACAKHARKAERDGIQVIDNPDRRWNRHHNHRLDNDEQVQKAREGGRLLAYPTPSGLVYYSDDVDDADGGYLERAHQERQDEEKQRVAALKARTAAAGAWVASGPPAGADVEKVLVQQILGGHLAHSDCLKQAWKWLGDQVGDTDAATHYSWAESLVDASAAKRRWVAWAIVIANAEQSTRFAHISKWTPDSHQRILDYLTLLTRHAGYTLGPWELARVPDDFDADHAGEGR